MDKKLFVGGLSWGTDENGLRGAFARFGEIVDARVVRDRVTNRSRGFGFVTFADPDAADRARSESDGKELDGRTVRVDWAQERPRGSGRGPRGGRRGPSRDIVE